MDEVLLHRSLKDYELGMFLLKAYLDNTYDDLNNALFHLQQAIEKAFKVYLKAKGIKYPRTHDIGRLRMLAEHEGLPNYATIEKYEDEIVNWEANTRYEFYTLDEVDVVYAITLDYCELYNYVNRSFN